MVTVTSNVFRSLGHEMIGRSGRLASYSASRQFRSLFGTSPEVCSILWRQVHSSIPKRGKPKHILWALLFLKTYATEDVLSTVVGVDRKTYRKWSWVFINAISHLSNVRIKHFSLNEY